MGADWSCREWAGTQVPETHTQVTGVSIATSVCRGPTWKILRNSVFLFFNGIIMSSGIWSGEEKKNVLYILKEQKRIPTGDLIQGILFVMVSCCFMWTWEWFKSPALQHDGLKLDIKTCLNESFTKIMNFTVNRGDTAFWNIRNQLY